jgi:hypothetical protein
MEVTLNLKPLTISDFICSHAERKSFGIRPKGSDLYEDESS